jgi:methyl-accepting chemotaxis protein
MDHNRSKQQTRSQLSIMLWAGAILFGMLAADCLVAMSMAGIGGPAYGKVIESKDLTADVIPPPLFLAEPYLLCYQASREVNPALRDAKLARLDSLRAQFLEATGKWKRSAISKSVKSELDATILTGEQFWSSYDSGFVPAMKNVDVIAASDMVNGPLSERFAPHRVAAMQLVSKARLVATNQEATAFQTRTWALLGICLFGLLGIATYTWSLVASKRLLRRLAFQAAIVEQSNLRAWIVNPDQVIVFESPASANQTPLLGDWITLDNPDLSGKNLASFHARFPSLCKPEASSRLELPCQAKVLSLESTPLQDAAGRGFGWVIVWAIHEVQLDAHQRETLAIKLKSETSALTRASEHLEDLSSRARQQVQETRRHCADSLQTSSGLGLAIGTVATAAEELATSIREISRASADAASSARQGAMEVEGSSQILNSLSQAGERIGQAVGSIDMISKQTRLLALNATIEAARAGEAGKGFAIVAHEVKELAHGTAQANQLIAEVVNQMSTEIGKVVGTMDSIRKVVGDLQSLSMGVNASVEQQALATGEIAQGAARAASLGTELHQAMSTLEDAAVHAEGNAAGTGEAAIELAARARELDSLAGILQV